jgi:hypothetical protein
VKYAEGVMVYDAEGGLMYEASVVDNSLSLLKKALLLSVATSCIMALVEYLRETPDKTRVSYL